ncbi:MAG: glycosyltransferase [Actinobacteria bacterium]|nr:glycosyltransferase [Actinomycetota bacterium]
MTDRQPLVSIVVPSYNQGKFIGATLESILSQDYRPIEILVMDGASTDKTVDVLRQFAERHPEVTWWSEPDKGVADAVNNGLQRASGEYAGIQSSDDLYRPGAVSQAVAALEGDQDVGLVYGDAEIIDEFGTVETVAPYRLPFAPDRFLYRGTVIHQSSAFFRLALARDVGGWNPDYFCCDTDMWLRMIFRTRAQRVDKVWSAWRKHPDQRDRDARRMWEDWARMTRESPDLRRAPIRLRLAAAAGRRLMAIDYNPSQSRWFRTRQIALALLTYPPSIAAVPPALLPPGVDIVRRGFRRLFFEPPGAQ